MKAPGNVQIDNRNGDVSLGVPEKMGFKLDARTHGGEVQSEFPEIKPQNDENDGRAMGTVGNGAVRVVVNNEHGNISLRKGPVESAHASEQEVPSPPKTPNTPHTPSPPSPPQPTEN